jgi:two-component system, NarL family, sensor kinase
MAAGRAPADTPSLRPVHPTSPRSMTDNGQMEAVRRSDPRRPVSVTASIAHFALAGFVALIVLAAGAGLVLRHAAETDALNDAKRLSVVLGRSVTADVTDELLSGSRATRQRLDAAVRRQVLLDPVVRVKVWDAQGRIIYSDEHRIEGQRFHLGDEERQTLLHGGADAELSDLSKPENRFERPAGKLLEVYQQIRTPGGTPLLFETYLRFSSVTAKSHAVWKDVLPPLLGALLLLELLQVPLAWRLLQRVRAGQREREALLRRALDASDTERQRIAADLHDGVIQTLAGANYQLASLETALAGPDQAQHRHNIAAAAQIVRQSIRQLRTLVVDIFPPSLSNAGLGPALTDLLTPLQQRGIKTDLTLPDQLQLPAEVEALLFRAAQEAVRNVVKHAGATSVQMEVTGGAGAVTLTVTDDGRGFPPGPVPNGHVGLRLIADYAAAAGGTVEQGNFPQGGAVVRVHVPVMA